MVYGPLKVAFAVVGETGIFERLEIYGYRKKKGSGEIRKNLVLFHFTRILI